MLGSFFSEFVALGNIPVVLLVYLPRLCVSVAVVVCAQFCRLGAWFLDETSDIIRQPKINKRVLIVTDYLPPQTHGIAIRFQQYITFMRKQGHEVHVFATTQRPELETSFDHPRLPSVTNPWNVKNRMAYNPGIRLAWTLGSRQWDVVHVVYPSLIGAFVIAVCGWRRIPVYASHHVDIDFYTSRYTRFTRCGKCALLLYDLLARLPCVKGATINAAPTLQFLKGHMAHMGLAPQRMRRIPTGVAHERFRADSPEHRAADRRALLNRIGVVAPTGGGGGGAAEPAVWLLVQRLAPEKDTGLVFGALALALEQAGVPGYGANGGARPPLASLPIQVAIAGDGPSMAQLQAEARAGGLPVAFLGNVEHDQLPPLYRAADLFVTCSTSETYGLTVVEALASGTPVALPHCEVFDELWAKQLPSDWMYEPSSPGPAPLLKALLAAAAPAARAWLHAHPVQVSWEAATTELLSQYDEAIESNMPYRREKSSKRVTIFHSVYASLAMAALYWLMRCYSRYLIRLFARAMMLDVQITN